MSNGLIAMDARLYILTRSASPMLATGRMEASIILFDPDDRNHLQNQDI